MELLGAGPGLMLLISPLTNNPISVDLNWVVILSRDTWQCLEAFLVATVGMVLLVSVG